MLSVTKLCRNLFARLYDPKPTKLIKIIVFTMVYKGRPLPHRMDHFKGAGQPDDHVHNWIENKTGQVGTHFHRCNDRYIKHLQGS